MLLKWKRSVYVCSGKNQCWCKRLSGEIPLVMFNLLLLSEEMSCGLACGMQLEMRAVNVCLLKILRDVGAHWQERRRLLLLLL